MSVTVPAKHTSNTPSVLLKWAPSLISTGAKSTVGDLENAARQHDQLGDRHNGHRPFDDLFEPGGFTLPLLLVGLLIAVFLGMEARRYRYFNVWRARPDGWR
jgi:hypothetical protein